MSRGQSRQDYIARIRYQNELPPPPCPPKLLDIPIDLDQLTSSSFLSGMVQKTPVNVEVDMDLGMPLDMTEIPGIFEKGDESGVYPVNPAAQLDPKDRVLMKEPAGSTGLSKAQPAVSFLRRTEYISSEIIKQKSFTDYKSAALKHREEQEKVNPEDQLRAVEATFDAANEDIGTLKHPTKKSVHAVDSWSVLPDSKMLDLVYLTVKIVGSAALSNQKRQYSRESLSTALFRRNVVDNDEWMTFFAADEEAASALKEKLDSPLDTLPVDDEDTSTYSFNRIQDHDIDLLIHSTQFEEIGIRFSEKEKQAKYVPIIGRTNLKRRRVLKQRRERVNENTIGAIDLSLREITAEESIVRDNARSVFDPVSYTATAIENVENEQDEEEDDLEQLAQ